MVVYVLYYPLDKMPDYNWVSGYAREHSSCFGDRVVQPFWVGNIEKGERLGVINQVVGMLDEVGHSGTIWKTAEIGNAERSNF
jgi:hypothetical protein